MTAGFQSFTTDGVLQFSSEYITHYFHSKGSRAMTQNGVALLNDPKSPDGTQNRLWTYPLFIGETNNVIQQDTYDIVLYSCATPLVGTSKGTTVATNQSGQTLYYWLFKPYSGYTPPSSGVGLQLYNASGQLGFDMSQKPLIMTANQPNVALSSGMDTALTLPAGRTYAAYMPNNSSRVVRTYNIGDNAGNAMTAGFRMTGGTVRLTEVDYYAYATENLNVGQLLVFDVTGL